MSWRCEFKAVDDLPFKGGSTETKAMNHGAWAKLGVFLDT